MSPSGSISSRTTFPLVYMQARGRRRSALQTDSHLVEAVMAANLTAITNLRCCITHGCCHSFRRFLNVGCTFRGNKGKFALLLTRDCNEPIFSLSFAPNTMTVLLKTRRENLIFEYSCRILTSFECLHCKSRNVQVANTR